MPTNTWDETVPAGSRLRSLGDDDMRQFKLDIRERLAAEHVSGDGTIIEASDFTETRHKLSSIGLLGLLKGLRIEQRSFATSGNITVSGKLQIEINGDMCYLNSDTNLAFSGLTASTSYYIYVASPGHETEIGAGNLSYSSTAPTYSTSKKGWYNGNSRAIGFFRAYSSGVYMIPFIQVNSIYRYLKYGYLPLGTITLSYTELSLMSAYLPIFVGACVNVLASISNGSSDSISGVLVSSDGVNDDGFGYIRVDTGATGDITIDLEISCPLSTARTIYAATAGSTDAVSLYPLSFDLDGSL